MPAVTDEYLIVAEPVTPVTEPAPEPVDPPTTTVPVETVPVDTTVPGEPPASEVPAELGLGVRTSLDEYTAAAAAVGFEVRVIERNGEPLDATDDALWLVGESLVPRVLEVVDEVEPDVRRGHAQPRGPKPRAQFVQLGLIGKERAVGLDLRVA